MQERDPEKLFCFVATDAAGELQAVSMDLPEMKKHTAKMVAECIRDGLTVERTTLADYRRRFVKDDAQ